MVRILECYSKKGSFINFLFEIFVLILYLSDYLYLENNRNPHYLIILFKLIIIVFFIIYLLRFFNIIYFPFLAIIPKLIIIYFYYNKSPGLLDKRMIDYYDKKIKISISIVNILISCSWLFYGYKIKCYLLILNGVIEIINFCFLLLLKCFFKLEIKKKEKILKEKLENERKKKSDRRKEIQKGNYQIIFCQPSEEEFTFNDYQIVFKRPKNIDDCDWEFFINIDENNLINKINNNIFTFSPDSEKDYFLMQTDIGDCFLVSSIISIVNIPGILDYLFYFENENKENYTHEDDYIFLFCYIRGVRTIIKIKNSFPSFKK